MITAAGILFLTPAGDALFLKRGPGGDHAGEWCFPGGKQEEGESLEACAVREAVEEIGSCPEGRRTVLTRQIAAILAPEAAMPAVEAPVASETPSAPPETSPGEAAMPVVIMNQPQTPAEQVDYTTFVQRVPDRFEPKVEGEHVGFAWAPVAQPPLPLHPGCQVVLDRLSMDELGIARAIRDGQLTSPQEYENVHLFAIRITGTGVAYRRSWDEFVWRDPNIYLNQEFLDRCNGLSVIMEHPKKAVLDSKEFADRVVGAILLPYLKGDEVWGVAKVYDDEAIKAMVEGVIKDTSPSVVFRDPDVNVQMELENGDKLLIEGKPSLLDHIALCKQGVWSKGGEPTGVLTEPKGSVEMTEEERKAAADRARADADAGEKLDKLLCGLDSIGKRMDEQDKRMDAMHTRMDSMRNDDDDDDDHGRYDRKDDDDDASYKGRNDAEEAKETEERVAKGEPKETAADKAKGHRKDAEDKFAKIAADKKKADDEARRRADSSTDVSSRIKAIESKLVPMSDEEYRARADAQAKADSVFQAFGESAPRPLDGENLFLYRRRVAGKLKEHSKAWKGVELSAIADAAAFEVAEKQIYADAMETALNPKDLPEGQLRAVTRADSTGRQITSFYGEAKSWMGSFSANRRRLAGIRNRDR